MKESEIAETLENAGFVLQPKRGTAIDAGRPTLRYSREGIRGSFYATDNYLVPERKTSFSIEIPILQ